MKTRNRTRRLLGIVTTLLMFALCCGSVWAHPRRYPHNHRSAAIVVGKPRPVRSVVVIHGRPHGTLDMNVKPKDTRVWVDGKLRGTCGEFDGSPGKLHLLPGLHRIRLATTDGVEVAREVRVRAGSEINIGLDLR